MTLSKYIHFNTRRIAKITNVLTLAGLVLGGAARLAQADVLHVSEEDARRSVVSRVVPQMPPLAKQVHITGRVVVDLTVTEDGSVEKADIVSGNPVLAGAAVKAGKGWMFSPFKSADGKPSRAVVRVNFEFGS